MEENLQQVDLACRTLALLQLTFGGFQVSGMVSNLRNMAIDMSTEVSNQNRQLDRINAKVIFMFSSSY